MQIDQVMCSIGCWQHPTVVILFRYSKSSVSLSDFQHFISAELSKRSIKIDCSFKLYYLKKEDDWSHKIKIDSDQLVQEYFELVRCDKTMLSKIMVSLGFHSPVKPPEDENMSSLSDGEYSGGDSGRGSVQAYFRRCVLKRDGSSCLFCNNSSVSLLKAAHLFDVFRAKDIPEGDTDFLRKYGLINIFDTCNGITLCAECHSAFDALLVCIRIQNYKSKKYSIEVANALLSQQHEEDKWNLINGKEINMPTIETFVNNWPVDALFNFRADKYDEYTVKRQNKAIELPFVCWKCWRRTKTVAGLFKHQQSKSCVERMQKATTSVSFKEMHTPTKDPTILQNNIKLKKKGGGIEKKLFHNK